MQRLPLALIFLTFNLTLVAQITFQRTFGGISDEHGSAIVETFDGGCVAVGWTNSFGSGTDSTGAANLYLLKLNSFGDQLWSQAFGGLSGDYGLDVLQSPDSGIVVLGMRSLDTLVVIKTNSIGTMEWSLPVVGLLGRSIESTMDGGYIVLAATEQFNNDNVSLIKLSSSGVLEWVKEIIHFGREDPWDIKQAPDGGFVVTGASGWSGLDHVFLMKMDSTGTLDWFEEYFTTTDDIPYSLEITNDHELVVAGHRDDIFPEAAFMMKMDSIGGILWEQEYIGHGSNVNMAQDVQQTQDGGFILAGFFLDTVYFQPTANLIRTDSDGNMLWNRAIPKTVQSTFWLNSSAFGVQETMDNGFLVVGSTLISVPSADQQLFVIKTNDQGVVSGLPTIPNADNIIAYPNPFSDQIYLSNAPNSSYTLYNPLGVRVSNGIVRDGLITGLHFLPPGHYSLVLKSGEITLHKAFIKE